MPSTEEAPHTYVAGVKFARMVEPSEQDRLMAALGLLMREEGRPTGRLRLTGANWHSGGMSLAVQDNDPRSAPLTVEEIEAFVRAAVGIEISDLAVRRNVGQTRPRGAPPGETPGPPVARDRHRGQPPPAPSQR